MFLSQLTAKTSKESSSDASSVNADLLTRAGFISKTMAGVYSFLPLGTRVLWKIEQILREEMDKIGAEVFLPAFAPVENWERTGRLETVDVIFQATAANEKGKKINDARYVLGSTHEEIITPLVQQFVQSYNDLPCALYQIQTKFRNEPRPKSGLLRGREFRMKDLYSFHASEEDMLDYFLNKAIPAYQAFFERIGLGEKTVIAFASGGSFSKEPSREFQTLCEMGEDLLFRIPGTDTYYNREIAPSQAPAWGNPKEKERAREDVVGKGIIGVEELAAFLKIEVERTTKTLIYDTDGGRTIAAAVRGDYDVNEEKLCAVAGCRSVELVSEEKIEKLTGAKVGYAGPIGLPATIEVYWDDSTAGRKNFECGANQTDKHTINANFGRDVPEPKEFYDIKVAKEGDLSPEAGKPYETFRASEVGNVFTLYTKFSDAFNFTFTDKDGSQKPVYMGCYGLGTTRVLGVLAEAFYDEHGLLWPEAVAPARVHIIPLTKDKDDEVSAKALEVYDTLTQQGIECLFDDRLDISVGSRLADADLIGIPLRIIVSPKSLKAGGVEVKLRAENEAKVISVEELREQLAN